MELFWKTNQRMSVNVCNILPVPTLTRLQVNEPDIFVIKYSPYQAMILDIYNLHRIDQYV